MAAELIQKDLTLTATPGKTVSFSCGTSQCSGNYVHWYQKKDGDNDYNHAQRKDFSAVKNENSCELEINAVSLVHSAIYYCSCAQSSHSDKTSLQAEQKPSKEQQQTTAQVHTHTHTHTLTQASPLKPKQLVCILFI
uniref:Ig-like domain-containing protein n=1 Tax=Haplochromis burtoni TaxID=8153 RepID=A0A3Q2WGU8_HAPBU